MRASSPFGLISEESFWALHSAFESVPPLPLEEEVNRFARGPGIYALYQLRAHGIYSELPLQIPLYVGKDHTLPARARIHRASLRRGAGLHEPDFAVRCLALRSWAEAPAAEALLQARFNPIWNRAGLANGLGNNQPGKHRAHQALSRWDVLHPGRGGREGVNSWTREQLEARVRQYIRDQYGTYTPIEGLPGLWSPQDRARHASWKTD